MNGTLGEQLSASGAGTAWRVPVLPVVTAVAAGAILLCWAASTGLQCDELLFLRAIRLGIWDSLLAPGSSHPPLARLLFAPAALPGAPDWMVRLPGILAAVVTIPIWYAILRRLIPDAMTVRLLLPAMALNVSWLAVGYQCVPYVWLTMFASLHALSWFWIFEKPGWRTGTVFVLSGAAGAWSHFYGVNLLVADQLVWAILLWRQGTTVRRWLMLSLATFLVVLPELPIALYFARLESGHSIVEIDNFGRYFLWASDAVFCKSTLSQMRWTGPLYILWYVAAGALVWKTLFATSTRSGKGTSRDLTRKALLPALVAVGIFLAGFPAAQIHAVLLNKPLWERYVVIGMWMHWPLLAMVTYAWWGSTGARRLAMTATALTMAGLLISRGWIPEWTFDFRPAIARISENARPGDAFLAQDFDMWVDGANFDRLWFQRYATVPMPVISGPTTERFELTRGRLPAAAAPDTVRRVWVYSSVFTAESLQVMQSAEWRLVELHTFERSYPLALFERAQTTGS